MATRYSTHTKELHMVHPNRDVAYLNKQFKKWGVFFIENVKVVIQMSMGRGLLVLKDIKLNQLQDIILHQNIPTFLLLKLGSVNS